MATQSPERVQGLVIEMPVLELAAPAAAITFVPMLLAVHVARSAFRVVGGAVRHLPTVGSDRWTAS